MRSLQRRGDDAFDAKLFQRAVQYYSDALDLDERNVEILGSRAAAYMEVGDGLLALRDAKRLSTLKPTNPQVTIHSNENQFVVRHLKGMCLCIYTNAPPPLDRNVSFTIYLSKYFE